MNVTHPLSQREKPRLDPSPLPIWLKKYVRPFANLLMNKKEISFPEHNALISLAIETNFDRGRLDLVAHLIVFAESPLIISFPCPEPTHRTNAFLMPRSSASFKSLIPTDSAKTKQDDLDESRKTPPIFAFPDFPLEAPPTLNLNVPYGSGDHFSFPTSLLGLLVMQLSQDP